MQQQQLSEIIKAKHYSVSVKNKKTLNTNTKNTTQTTFIAEKLCQKLNNPSRFKYYCLIAWRLPESKIWSNLETALAGRDPQKLFSWLCQQDLK